ncbi:hypothetical protein VP01_3627g1 [Puccinia sorghi]|uniref:Uncharacterized protein n=1 Tax=Puccinia sorghi TaxID=27349 RepID=A0A0L6UWQ1_9BASI|nr:hypothetical protein VP01_3627g1 [Puccinia sorghi]
MSLWIISGFCFCNKIVASTLNDLNTIELDEVGRKGTSVGFSLGEEHGSACVFAERICWGLGETCKVSLNRRLSTLSAVLISLVQMSLLALQNAPQQPLLICGVLNSNLISIIHQATAQHFEPVLDSLAAKATERVSSFKPDCASSATAKSTAALETSLNCLATVAGVRNGSRLSREPSALFILISCSYNKMPNILHILGSVLDLPADTKNNNPSSLSSSVALLSLNLLSSIKDHSDCLELGIVRRLSFTMTTSYHSYPTGALTSTIIIRINHKSSGCNFLYKLWRSRNDRLSVFLFLPSEHMTFNHDEVVEWFQCVPISPKPSDNDVSEGLRTKYISDYKSGTPINRTMLLSTMINVACRPCNTTKSHPCLLPMDWLPFVVSVWGWHRGILTTVRDICRDAQNRYARSSMSLSFEYIYQPHKLALLSESHVIRHLALKVLHPTSGRECSNTPDAYSQIGNHVYSSDVLVILLFFLRLPNLILPTCCTSQLKVHFQPLWEESLQALTDLNAKHHVNFWELVWSQLNLCLWDSSEIYFTPRVQPSGHTSDVPNQLPGLKLTDQAKFRCTHKDKVIDLFSSDFRNLTLEAALKRQSLEYRLDIQKLRGSVGRSSIAKSCGCGKAQQIGHGGSFHLLSRLRHWLRMFSTFTNPKAFCHTHVLRAVFDDLLTDPNPDLCRLSLECVLTWQDSSLVRHPDDFQNLLDSTQFPTPLNSGRRYNEGKQVISKAISWPWWQFYTRVRPRLGQIGYPVIVRAGHALRGGFANNDEEIQECNKTFAITTQVLIEGSMKGWQEIKYKIVRDCRASCITLNDQSCYQDFALRNAIGTILGNSLTTISNAENADYHFLSLPLAEVDAHNQVFRRLISIQAYISFVSDICVASSYSHT